MRVRLHMLPLALAAIVITTAVPIDIAAPVEWGWGFRIDDVAVNVVLYAPLGIALWRRPLWVTLAVAFALSGLIEYSQIWSIDRFSSPLDVASNTVGAVFGAFAWRVARQNDLVPESWPTVGWRSAIALLLITAGIITLWWRPARSSAIADWDPTFPLQLGNERNGGRAWRGSISALAILPSALSKSALRELGAAPAGNWPEVARDAVYVSTQPIVFDGGPAVELPPSAAAQFAERATRANAFTIAARLRIANLQQRGPARIVTFSPDHFQRNFDVGQDGPALAFRIRTPVTGPNGSELFVTSAPALRANEDMTIAATYNGIVAKMFVDGALVARTNVSALGCTVKVVCGGGEKEIWAGLGGMLALLAIFFVSTRSTLGVSMCAAAGAGVVLLLPWLHPAPARIASAGWTPALALLGAAVVAVSVIAAERRGRP